MQKNKLGSNQYRLKHKHLLGITSEAWRDIWFVAFITAVLIPLIKPTIVSPCPQDGCFVQTIEAKENMSPEEYLIVKAIRKFGLKHLNSFKTLIDKESSFNQFAINPTSGACGYFQALPCKKMQCHLYDAECQIEWGLRYIEQRYGNPTNALAFWEKNKSLTGNGWY